MHSKLDTLHAYPFARLNALLADVASNPELRPIDLGIGEPRHPPPRPVLDALSAEALGVRRYPKTVGTSELRTACAAWADRRYGLTPSLDPDTEVLPINGSREALFGIAQVAVDATGDEVVLMPNPFYQIYEGAAILAGATPVYLPLRAEADFLPDLSQVPERVWQRCTLLYLCFPGNPTGAVAPLSFWETLFAMADRYGTLIASDECYSELYPDETAPPLGALTASHRLGRRDFKNVLVFQSLSKRSNLPGLRSGFVAGDAVWIERFLRYRTYQGGAMSPVIQAASTVAWQDEAHVRANRDRYRSAFQTVAQVLAPVREVVQPPGAFYLWLESPIPDEEFCVTLWRDYSLRALPGSYLSREVDGECPGRGYVRISVVEQPEAMAEAAKRLVAAIRSSA